VYFSEVQSISKADLQTIDELWRVASNNKFGYSMQREVWMQCSKRWPQFFQKIDWVTGEHNTYRCVSDAPCARTGVHASACVRMRVRALVPVLVLVRLA
jgi:GUN4-like